MDSVATPLNEISDSDLESILDAWHEATLRLQRTHESLRHEVRKLTDELEAKNRELARENRLADLGRMAAHVAHEVRNSLVPMTLYVSMLRRQMTEEYSQNSILHKLESGFSALEATVNDLLHFTTGREPNWQRFDLRSLVDEVCESLAAQIEAQGIKLDVDMPSALPMTGDRNMLYRALLNVLLNSVDVMTDGGLLAITSWSGGDRIELEIADSGPGIDLDEPTQVFEPFFTTKQGGTGLGLAIVEHILSAHHGHVHVANCPEGGAAFTFIIPRRAMEAAA